jgi:alkylation response protein AidB-like acyl-CoA dehydrogenase
VRFDLSDDQRALREAAHDLLESRCTSERVRAAMGAAEGYDAGLWREMTAQGWPALELPESADGLGLGFVEATVLAEQVGRYAAPAPYVSTALATWTLQAGAPGHEWGGRFAAGGIGAVAQGAESLVVDAPAADIVVVVGDGVAAYDVSGRRPARQPAMDETRTVGRLDLGGLDRLPLDVSADAVVDRAAVLTSALLLGASERLLEDSVSYAGVREQFGRPIGSFQAVKHRCADMLVDVEGMRSAVYYAAWAVDTGAPDASLAASTAKAWAGDAGPRVASSALQVHGGIGFTWDHDLHLFLKRAQLDSVTFGDASWHRERIARLLTARLEAGAGIW